MRANARLAGAATIFVLLACVVGLQAARERHEPAELPPGVVTNLLYVRSPEFVKRAALAYDAIVADMYWVRAVQHYGRTRLLTARDKQYDLLYPLLDFTTSLDPHFNIAYRFGAIFLAEPPPAGPGRPDQAIALLEKGLKVQPERWEFAQDIGFVYYWSRHDYAQAAEWFSRAAKLPDAPNWMAPLAAVALSEGGNVATSRRLWQQIMSSARAEEEWLRDQARFRLRQLDAVDTITVLEAAVTRYQQRTGALPVAWSDMISAGYLTGVPTDSEGRPFQLNPYWGTVTLDPRSPLNPLPLKDPPAA